MSTVRVNDDIKKEVMPILDELGISLSEAINIFLYQIKINNGIPFELKKKTVNPYVTLTEDEVLKKLEASRQHASEGMVRDADDVISDMRQKYGI